MKAHGFGACVAIICRILLCARSVVSNDSEVFPGIGGSGGIGGHQTIEYEPSVLVRDVECTLYLEDGDILRRVVTYDGSGQGAINTEIVDDDEWVCGDIVSASGNIELESVVFADILGDGFDIQSQIVSANAKPGMSKLIMSEIVLKPRSAEIIIPIGSRVKIEDAVVEDRKLAPSNGILPAVMVRVIDANGVSPTATKEYLKAHTFGGNGITSAADQFEACSHGALTITPKEGQAAVIDINIDISIVEGITTRRDVSNEAVTEFRNKYDENQFELVMFCLPKGTIKREGSETWLAYAVANKKFSYYNDEGDWCKSVSAKMHEIGHNLNLGHSGEKADTDDLTGLMGRSYDETNSGFAPMCFNAAKNYQLGWYAKAVKSFNPLSGGFSRQTFNMIGVHDYNPNFDYSNDPKLVVMRLIASGENDYYIGFNSGSGINGGVKEASDKIVIIQKNGKPEEYSTSTRKAILGFGQSYKILNYNDQEGRVVKIKLIELIDNVATIDVVVDPEDEDDDDDFVECKSEQTPLTIEVLADLYPKDIEWTIYKDGAPEHFFNGYSRQWDQSLYENDEEQKPEVRTVCLNYDTTYDFEITDSYADGICCKRGLGYYRGIDAYGNVLFVGGHLAPEGEREYGDGESKEFRTPSLLVFETEFPTVTVITPTGAAPVAPTNAPIFPTKAPISTPLPTNAPVPQPTKLPTNAPVTPQATRLPTNSPVAPPPTRSPVVTPAPTSAPMRGDCENVSNKFQVKGALKDCKWVNQKKGQRCDMKTDNGEALKHLCPKKCEELCLPCKDKRGKIKIKKKVVDQNGDIVKVVNKYTCSDFQENGLKCTSKVKGKKKIKDFCRRTCGVGSCQSPIN